MRIVASARWSLLVPLLLVSLLVPSTDAAAEPPRVYHLDQLEVILLVAPSGDIRVLERMEFNFTSGNFSMAYRTIPHFGFDELTKATVYDGDGDPVMSGSTYLWDNFKGKYEIRWTFDPVLGPANRTFILDYTVSGGVAQVNKDQNAFDWYAVGPDWGVRIGKVNVTIVLPENISSSPLFKTSPRNMDRQADRFGTYLFLNRTDLPAHTPVRVIVHFPKSTVLQLSWERWLRENSMLVAGLISGIVLAIYLANSLLRFGLSRLPPRSPNPQRRLHSHPAKLATLLAGRYTPAALLAGAVALARRGALRIQHLTSQDDLRFEVREIEEPVGSHDVLLLSVLGEDASARALSGRWPALRRELQKHCRIELKLDGMVRYSGRAAWASIIGGLVPLLVGSITLALLIYADRWDAVLYGGVLLGTALAGTSILVVGGLLTPNLTFRGCRERASQLAFADGIQAKLEETAASRPGELAGPLLQYLPVLTAAGSAGRDGLAGRLRHLSSLAPSAPLEVSWYECHEPGAPAEPTLGRFARNFSATAQELPRMLTSPAEAGPAGEEPDSGLYTGKGGPPPEVQFTEVKEEGKGEP
jgi:hypothetical protein